MGVKAPFHSIRASLEFWSHVGASEFVLSIISNGYSLNFNSVPNCSILSHADNRASAKKESEFVEGELERLLESGAVVEKQARAEWPLGVAEGKKLRLIHDLSELNLSLNKSNFSLESLENAWPLLDSCNFLATFDLRAGYHHIPMSESASEMLGFVWKSRHFQFRALPFGLSSGPFVFTKVFRVLVSYWRSLGVKVFLYLDDGLIVGETRTECERSVRIVRETLNRAGAQVAEEKSDWSTREIGEWLGYVIDLAGKTVSLTERRIEKAVARLKHLGGGCPSIRDREVVQGTINSCHLVSGDTASLLSREISTVVANAVSAGSSGDTVVPLSERERGEIHGWLSEFRERTTRSCKTDSWVPQAVIECDASAEALGAVLKFRNSIISTSKNLSREERVESSAYRELLAVGFAIETFGEQLGGASVIIRTDSQAATSVLKRGSMKPHLHEIAMRVFHDTRKHCISARFCWVPRDQNVLADEASRDVDRDDWAIQQEKFLLCCRRWGRPQIDVFADEKNAKCQQFFSRRWCKGSSGEDAFEWPEAWRRDAFLWLVPPPSMLLRTLVMAHRMGSRAIMGFPMWRSSPAFPFYHPAGQWAPFIRDSIVFGKGASIFVPSQYDSGPFSSEFTSSEFAFVLVDFSK